MVSKRTKLAENYSIFECHPPKEFIGKSLAQLRLRNSFGLEVIMIRKPKSEFEIKEEQEIIMPNPEYPIEKNDTLVLFGSNDNIKKVEKWK